MHTMLPWTIEKADEELETAWHAIREMLPDVLSKHALGMALAETFEAAHAAENTFIDAVVRSALVMLPRNSYEQEQARCPLCRRASSAMGMRGFVYPEGLHRHLHGSGARKCPVVEALWQMARRNVRSCQESEKNYGKARCDD